MIVIKGLACEWYKELYSKCIESGIRQHNRQGLNLELPHPVHIIIPAANSEADAMFSATVHRRSNIENRLLFSMAHGAQKLIGLPESSLSKRFPILNNYINTEEESSFERSVRFIREPRQTAIKIDEEWISIEENEFGKYDVIDQLHLAIYRIVTSTDSTTRRAYIDFNEGYKPRCVSSWHLLVRDNKLEFHQHSRSTDMLVGMPNDLLAARFAQVALSKILGLKIGELHHQATVVQVYSPDVAGIDGVQSLKRLTRDDELESKANRFYRESRFLTDITSALEIKIKTPHKLKEKITTLRKNIADVLTHHIDIN